MLQLACQVRVYYFMVPFCHFGVERVGICDDSETRGKSYSRILYLEFC